MIWLLGILVYTLVSGWFFLSTMGMKYRKEHWYDWPLLLPTLVIAYIVGYINEQYR